MKEENVDSCDECGNFFDVEELKEIDDKLYCEDCSSRCSECNEMLNEDFCFNNSFCSKFCKDQYFYDLGEDEYK